MRHAFTLVELLVIVTIIVILIALLAPALDKATTAAQRAKCLVIVRNTTHGMLSYSAENKGLLPVWQMVINGANHTSSAYDYRGTWSEPDNSIAKFPLGVGLLVPTGFLPTTQLGKMIHCPNLDNSSGAVPGHGMDVGSHGGSGWVEHPNYRIYGGYNYRAPSYFTNGGGDIRRTNINSRFALYVDVPDVRFRGPKGIYSHAEGYSRSFGDGSTAFRLDPEQEVYQHLISSEPSGIMHGGISGGAQPAYEEAAWQMLEREPE